MQVQAVPPEAWETARLKPIEAFRVMEFRYPVSRYVGAVDEENPFPRLARKKTWVVAYRYQYSCHRMDLTQPAYELLSALAAGQTVGDAIVSVLTRKWRPAVKQDQLFEWFRDWMAEGFFQAVELAEPVAGSTVIFASSLRVAARRSSGVPASLVRGRVRRSSTPITMAGTVARFEWTQSARLPLYRGEGREGQDRELAV